MIKIHHKFHKQEVHDLLKSWLILSLAFTILLTGLHFSIAFFINFTLSSLTVGLGFLLHELAHKFVAERYGVRAIYKADPMMLAVTLISSLFGFIFAAPGGVYILGHLSKKRNGIVSLAGPLTNIILAILFLGLGFLVTGEYLLAISSYGLLINAWLGAFNMIPFNPFDGKKILDWNKGVYGLTTFIAVALVFVKFILP